jgi:hypothetical protein
MKNKLMFSVGMTAILFLVAASFSANASQVESVQVSPGYQQMVSFNLSVGQKFTGSLAITGGSGNDINFWVTDPQGSTILNLGRVSLGRTFGFTAESSGAYTLHFDNSFSLISSKAVTLTYDLSLPTVLGLDFGVLLIIITVVVILLVVIAVLGVALSHRKRISKTYQSPPQPAARNNARAPERVHG